MRPLRGDHIHQAFAVYVHGELVDIVWDQEWLGTADPSEGKTYPLTFSNLSAGMCALPLSYPYRTTSLPLHRVRPYHTRVRLDAAALTPTHPTCRNEYHITTTHPHFGMHAGQAYWFGDGMIHSHPGTSWQWFQHTEGLGATLGAYLEQTGVSAAPTLPQTTHTHEPTPLCVTNCHVLHTPFRPSPICDVHTLSRPPDSQVAFYDGVDSRYPIGQWHVPFPHEVNRTLEQNAMTFPDIIGGKPTMVGGQYACEQDVIPPGGLNGQNVGAARHLLRHFETVPPDARRATSNSCRALGSPRCVAVGRHQCRLSR